MKLCRVEDCERPHHGRGLCGAHYAQWLRTGFADGAALLPLSVVPPYPPHTWETCPHYPRFRHLGVACPCLTEAQWAAFQAGVPSMTDYAWKP